MPQKSSKLRFLIIAVVIAVIYLIAGKGCKARAEADPSEHHYGPEFETPDPNGNVYEVIESDNPEITLPELTWQPIALPTDDPDIINSQPQTSVIKYDPFLVFQSGSYIKYKRLNGTIVSYTPPVSTANLHTCTPSVSSASDNSSYAYYFNYLNMPVSGITQSTTEHELGKASLVYIVYSDLTTNSEKKISTGDTVMFDLAPHLVFNCTDPELLYTPSAVATVSLQFKSKAGNNVVTTKVFDVEFKMSNNGSDVFSIEYEYDQSDMYYLAAYEILLQVNMINGGYSSTMRDEVLPKYYYTQNSDPVFHLTVFHNKDLGEKLSGWFNTLTSHISDLFVPNEAQIQAWISNHASDELDADNPLNLVKDLFVSMMDIFSGYNTGLQRKPVIDVPALSFAVNGQTVTPFEGFSWRMTENEPGQLWYYVKLCNSIIIATGLVSLMLRWFYKWYDAHYAGSGGGDSK